MSTLEAQAPSLGATDALVAWMDAQGLGKGAPLHHRYISGGSQNHIYELRRGDFRCVMRIPPPTAAPERDKGIVREWRIIEALTGTDVPHTPAVAVCTDESVAGRTFYLMGFIDGWSPMGLTDRRWPEPFDSDLAQRRGLAWQLVEGAALMSKVDWQRKGLADLGRPEGFHERQVDRWTAFYEHVRTRDLPGFETAAGWLRSHKPLDYVPGIMHGDYQFANVMYEHGGPARLAAIVDWEMGTIGDPKLDLAWVVHAWPANPDEPQAISYVDYRGLPTRDELLAHYSEVSGRQVDDIDFYCVLAKWKLAVVLEQTVSRGGPKGELFSPVVANLMAEAGELAATVDYRG
jgi:aminoglycoside phosphotransferase (APT) family kinase protein